MQRHRLQRNKKIRERFRSLREQGTNANDIIDDLSREYFLSFDTVKNIIYDGKYDTRYLDKKSLAQLRIQKSPPEADQPSAEVDGSQ